jgi:hypothetical protein
MDIRSSRKETAVVLYRVYTSGPIPNQHITRKRSDAALLAAENVAYDLIAGQAGLDTPWGRKAMQAVRNLDPSRGGSVMVGDHAIFLTCDRSEARS